MKRLLYAATLAMLAMLVLAPAALAQESERFTEENIPIVQDPEECPPLFTGTPTGEGSFACIPPCEGIISQADFEQCAAEQEAVEAQFAAQAAASQAPAQQTQAPSTTQQTPVTTNDTQLQEMPDTGGPGLLTPVAALFIGSGILGLAWSQRRSL